MDRNENFNSLPWHDARILELVVDRHDAGERDEVRLRVVWPQGEEATLVFRDCYAMRAEMNFGIIADELIDNAASNDADPGLALLQQRWGPLGVSLDGISCYRLEMSSTASGIRIYARNFEIV